MVDGDWRVWTLWFACGIVIGAAESVPGASGASLAMVLGVYAALLRGIGANRDAAFRMVGIVCLGIVVGVALLGGFLSEMLINCPVALRAFCFGFLACAIALIGARQTWRFDGWVTLMLGAMVGATLSRVELVATASPLNTFVHAMCASVGMLLPGGMGWARLVTDSVAIHASLGVGLSTSWVLIAFGAGAILGTVLGARLIATLLQRFPIALWAFLLGMALNGLSRLWPWQRIDAYTLTIGGDIVAMATTPLSPWQYSATTGADAGLTQACVLMLLAGLLAWRCTRQPSVVTSH